MINIARMYARRKGKSGSKKPLIDAKWTIYSKEEIERIIIKLANDKLQTAKIGLILRDQYGIPSVKAIAGKTVSKILEENDLTPKLPEDMFNLLKRAVNLRNHLEKNKRDKHSKRGLELVESKVRRLSKYYVKIKRVPEDWKYNPEQAKLIVEKGR